MQFRDSFRDMPSVGPDPGEDTAEAPEVRRKAGKGALPGHGYTRPHALLAKVKEWQPWELDRALLPTKPPGRR
jgi:hypothetical protein